jgi:formylglycine-generating enzyme
VCVNWYDAEAFAAWAKYSTGADYRLLTEAEAEYAARGVSKATRQPRYFFGDNPGLICRYANSSDLSSAERFSWDRNLVSQCRDGHATTAPVGSFKAGANLFGLPGPGRRIVTPKDTRVHPKMAE